MSRTFGELVVPTADAFRVAFTLGLVAAIASSVIAVFIPRHLARPQGEHPALPDGD